MSAGHNPLCSCSQRLFRDICAGCDPEIRYILIRHGALGGEMSPPPTCTAAAPPW